MSAIEETDAIVIAREQIPRIREIANARAGILMLCAEHNAEVWNEVSVALHEEYKVCEDARHAEHLRQRSEVARRFAKMQEAQRSRG